MSRRKPYTSVERHNFERPDYCKGMGDVVFRGFQCLNRNCREYIFVQETNLGTDFEVECPTCGMVLRSGESTKIYDYDLKDLRDNSIIVQGEFSILHDDYVGSAPQYKYCIICCTLKPLSAFDHHATRKSRRQGECRLCKLEYNTIKNPTRTSDQHREAAQMRRFLIDLTGGNRIDSQAIYERFKYRCFKCGADLQAVESEGERPIDHTLPLRYLWPATTDNATLLCKDHNLGKSGKWPSEYYSDSELRALSVLTGVPHEVLSGAAQYNPEMVEGLKSPQYVDEVLQKNAPRMRELIKLRNRLLRDTGFDFFTVASGISPTWAAVANQSLSQPEDERLG